MLCEGWQPKTTSALDSGTKQKTEDFEVRKNWVLFCGDYSTFLLFSLCKLTKLKEGNIIGLKPELRVKFETYVLI